MGGILSLRKGYRTRTFAIVSIFMLLLVVVFVSVYFATHKKSMLIIGGIIGGIYSIMILVIAYMYIRKKIEDNKTNLHSIRDYSIKNAISTRIPHISYSIGKPKEMSFKEILDATIKNKFTDPVNAIEELTAKKIQAIEDSQPKSMEEAVIKQIKVLLEQKYALEQLVSPSFLNMSLNKDIQSQRYTIQERIADLRARIGKLMNANKLIEEDLSRY